MTENDHISYHLTAGGKLATDIAAATTFADLEQLRQKFAAATALVPEERHALENALANRERDLINFYLCRP
jgi:hypothetical protein